MKVIFFGTPLFAAKHLEALVRKGKDVEIVAVVTKPDRPQGRSSRLIPTPVKAMAQSLLPHVPLFQPEKCSAPEFVELLKGIPADLYVVVAYGEIMKQPVLDVPRFGCINVHASVLPGYRGAAPMHRVLMNGEKETGITIIHLVLKMDAGDILHTEKIDIPQNMTFPELEQELCEVGIRCLLAVIDDFKNGVVQSAPQDHSLATYADKVTVEECFIDWSKPALQLHNLVRGTTPNPGAWCSITIRGQKKRIKILRSEYVPEVVDSPGKVIYQGKNQQGMDRLIVATGNGGLLLKEVQLEGKQAITVAELLRAVSPQEMSFI